MVVGGFDSPSAHSGSAYGAALDREGARMPDLDYREWSDDNSVCMVCREPMGKSQELICSATCEDILNLRKMMGDCHA
jgi:hypothetical protein